MSESVEKREPKPAVHPKELSPEYHKARKQLMLWSAILFVWEMVGIDLEKAKEAGGNAGAIIGAIKSPQAIPWALLILVIYFLVKCWIEWAQCHPDRRRVLVARIDFYLAALISLLSVALYAGQAIRRVQFADLGIKGFLVNIGAIAVGLAAGIAVTERVANLISRLLGRRTKSSPLPKK